MMNRPFPSRRQRGATLLVSLIMLVVLTLFAVAGFNLSSVNLRIAGNFQDQKSMEAAALQAIEEVISKGDVFNAPVAQTIPVGGYNVSVTAPRCNYSAPAEGFSLKEDTLVPDDNDWEFTASVTDATSGARATITQGVRIRMLAGNCPT